MSSRIEQGAARDGAHVSDQPAVRRPDPAGDARPCDLRTAAAPARIGGGRSAAAREWSRRSAICSSAFASSMSCSERTAILPYGKQRLLEIALAFACRPRAAPARRAGGRRPGGRAPGNPRHHRGAARRTSRSCLIEHDMDIVFSFADRISVLVEWRDAGRGLARTKSRMTRGCGPSISARRSMPDLLTIERLTRRLRRSHRAVRRDAVASGGACARAARPQRHGQNHAHQFDRRASRAIAAAPSTWPVATSPRLRPTSGRMPASAGCRRSATSSNR